MSPDILPALAIVAEELVRGDTVDNFVSTPRRRAGNNRGTPELSQERNPVMLLPAVSFAVHRRYL